MATADPHAGHGHADHTRDDMPGTKPHANGSTAIDPVCGMTVPLTPDTRTESFGDEAFHFCSEKCRTKFRADPWFYASGRAARRKQATPANVQYICRM